MDLNHSSALTQLLRILFNALYTHFAWTYDAVAWLSSGGDWKSWTKTILTELPEGAILELGHGPGHLQLDLGKMQISSFALDPSQQMSRIARKRLRNSDLIVNLCLGEAQHLPFKSSTFHAVLTTFPTNYIYETRSIMECFRVLNASGVLSILAFVRIIRNTPVDRVLRWAFKVTGQDSEINETRLIRPFEAAGFAAHIETIKVRRGLAYKIVARKPA